MLSYLLHHRWGEASWERGRRCRKGEVGCLLCSVQLGGEWPLRMKEGPSGDRPVKQDTGGQRLETRSESSLNMCPSVSDWFINNLFNH